MTPSGSRKILIVNLLKIQMHNLKQMLMIVNLLKIHICHLMQMLVIVSNSSVSYWRFNCLPDVQDGIKPLNSYSTILSYSS
jgi:hypothetical protein